MLIPESSSDADAWLQDIASRALLHAIIVQ
jgi:hypothetical protein